MRIEYTRVRDVTFSVEYFEATEGGMDHDCIKSDIETLEEAIDFMMLANAKSQYGEYIVTVQVKEKVK